MALSDAFNCINCPSFPSYAPLSSNNYEMFTATEIIAGRIVGNCSNTIVYCRKRQSKAPLSTLNHMIIFEDGKRIVVSSRGSALHFFCTRRRQWQLYGFGMYGNILNVYCSNEVGMKMVIKKNIYI